MIKIDKNSNYCIMGDKNKKILVRHECDKNIPHLLKRWDLELTDSLKSHPPPIWSKFAIHPPRQN